MPLLNVVANFSLIRSELVVECFGPIVVRAPPDSSISDLARVELSRRDSHSRFLFGCGLMRHFFLSARRPGALPARISLGLQVDTS